MTAQSSTSGTSITFTGIPSTAKRITVMFSNVSTNGTSNILIQIGSGSVVTTGYISSATVINNGATTQAATSSTAGFIVYNDDATDARHGSASIVLLGSNLYCQNHVFGNATGRNNVFCGGGSVTLSGALDRVVITTANGTDTFDLGSINVIYE
jgi:hypothetical protein